MLSGILLYFIPPGLVRIGKNSDCENSSENLDIMLDGPLVRPLHWLVGSFAIRWIEKFLGLVHVFHLYAIFFSITSFF